MVTETGRTLPEFFKISAEKFADRELFVFTEFNVRYTYSEFYGLAEKCAVKLRSLGLKKGFKAVICMETRPEWYIFFWGVQMAGGIVVNYSHKSTSENLRSTLEKTEASLLLVSNCSEISDFNENIRIIVCGGNVPDFCTSWESFIESPVEDTAINNIANDENETCLIQFTSGSSEKPKGVMLSHRGIIYVAFHNADNTGLSGDDKIIVVAPLSHSLGLINCMLAPMMKGASIYPISEFTPGHAVKCIAEHGITMTIAVPSMFMQIFEYADRYGYNISTFTKGAVGGASFTPESLKYLICEKGMTGLVHGYGMTEFTSGMAVSYYYDDVEVKMNTVGRVMPGSEAMIIDLNTGEKITEAEKEGELYFRGPGRMNGYFGEDSNEISSPEIFYPTGDIVKIRKDGNLVITGRKSDIVIKGGENISPSEVEHILKSCSGITDALVGGIHDDMLGEELISFVKTDCSTDEKAIRKEMVSKTEEHKIPKYIIMVEDFIYNQNAKPDKKTMIRHFMENNSK